MEQSFSKFSEKIRKKTVAYRDASWLLVSFQETGKIQFIGNTVFRGLYEMKVLLDMNEFLCAITESGYLVEGR